ncbi:MAG: sodium:solute symporter, partial [Phycisphaerae bacterium]|nr:sodium:solute symporter [Phycisphaerae bacterium]
CNAWGCTVGITLGGTAAIVQRIVWKEMLEWQLFVSITLLTLVATILGSLLTTPDTLERLRHFYRTTRPFGLWRPVRETFSAAEQRVLTAEHRNDIIAVPFVLLWQITLFLLPMQLVIRNYAVFWRILPAFLLGCAGMYWFWYRKLPPAKPVTALMSPPGPPPTAP